jgi:DNA processing protein
MSEDKYLVLLYSYVPFGPVRTSLLISFFGSSKKAWEASEKELLSTGLKGEFVRGFVHYRNEISEDKFFDVLKKKNINYVTADDKDYPHNLVDLNDAPLVLYYKGTLKKDDINAVAIVGSRKMTSYGKEVTRIFATELSHVGVTIVSGLAFGVDLMAHKTALEVGGRCVAVLASGLDEVSPRTNTWLAKKILDSGGALVSEYPPGTGAQRHYFPYRNRIISGLSKGVLIVEGMMKSGTIHTAKAAADQGRPVFAVPGMITSPNSQAAHYLIKNGAVLTTSVADILDELNLQILVDGDKVNEIMPEDDVEQKILEVLDKEPIHLDKVVRITNMDVSTVSARLTIMVMKGLVVDLGNGMYRKNNI